MNSSRYRCVSIFALCAIATVAVAQTPPPAAPVTTPADKEKPAEPTPPPPAAPAALPTPAISGPLSGLPPAVFDAGPAIAKLSGNGGLSRRRLWAAHQL